MFNKQLHIVPSKLSAHTTFHCNTQSIIYFWIRDNINQLPQVKNKCSNHKNTVYWQFIRRYSYDLKLWNQILNCIIIELCFCNLNTRLSLAVIDWYCLWLTDSKINRGPQRIKINFLTNILLQTAFTLNQLVELFIVKFMVLFKEVRVTI